MRSSGKRCILGKRSHSHHLALATQGIRVLRRRERERERESERAREREREREREFEAEVLFTRETLAAGSIMALNNPDSGKTIHNITRAHR